MLMHEKACVIPIIYNKNVKKLLKYCVVKQLFNGPVYSQWLNLVIYWLIN